jgi:DNA-binding NarL/FixJ family response regulator
LAKALSKSEKTPLAALIAEDDPRIARMLSRAVSQLGYSVAGIAANGIEAVEMARTLPVDFLIIDIVMPEMDGIEAARRILAERSMPVIVSTGFMEDDLLDAARRLPAQAFLVKPFTKDQLGSTIAIALEQHKMLLEAREKIAALTEQARPAHEPRISAEALDRRGLTPREIEVLGAMAEGKSNAEIAESLGASVRTVDKHVQHIFEKLAVKSRTAAVARALQLSAQGGEAD